MLRTLLDALRTRHAATPIQSDSTALVVAALRMRIEELERSEATRNAEHHAMVDRLDRLYKRLSSRIARSDKPPEDSNGESTLSLRNRLGR